MKIRPQDIMKDISKTWLMQKIVSFFVAEFGESMILGR